MNKKFIYFLNIGIFIFLNMPCFGQYFLKQNINSAKGLPQNTIRDFVYSKSGFLWMATEDGLVKYDGNQIITFHNNNSSLDKNRLIQFIVTQNGRIYVMDEANKVFEIIENINGILLKYIGEVPVSNFNMYAIGKLKNIEEFFFIWKKMHALHNFRSFPFAFKMFGNDQYFSLRTPTAIEVYTRDCKYITTFTAASKQQDDLFSINNQFYLIQNDNQILKLDVPNKRLIKINKINTNPGHILSDAVNQKTYWRCDSNLFEMKEIDRTLVLTSITHQIPNYPIHRISQTKNADNIFIGTVNNGCFEYRKNKFSIYTSGKGNNCFYAQALISSNKSILTSNMHALGVGIDELKTEIGIYNAHILYRAPDQNIWFVTSDTIKSFNPLHGGINPLVVLPKMDFMGTHLIYEIDSLHWYLCTGKSLFLYDKRNGIKTLNDFHFSSDIQRPYSMLALKDSLFYIGTDNGIYLFNAVTNSLSPYLLKGIVIRNLFRTKEGYVLAGSYGHGYFSITEKGCIQLPFDRNGNLKNTHSFIEDKRNNLWISTNNGLYKIAKKNIYDYVQGNHDNKFYYYKYSIEDGLLTNEFNGGCTPNVVTWDSITYSLPSMQGLVWLKPDSLMDSFDSTDVFVNKILLNEKAIQISDSIIDTKTHDFKLNIFLSTPHWSDLENLYIEYQLDPNSDTALWYLIKNIENPLSIQNLAGGKHLLRIRKKLDGSKEKYSYLNLTIQVPKLIYECTWFWIVCGLFLVLLGYIFTTLSNLIINRQKKKLEILVKAKTQELQNAIHLLESKNTTIQESESNLKTESDRKSLLLFLLTHDIASPLRFVNKYLSTLSKNASTESITIDDLTDIAISTTTLESLLNNILAWIKQTQQRNFQPENKMFYLSNLVDEKIDLFSLANKKKKNKIKNNIPKTFVLFADEFIVSMAIQNLFGNATNYTKNGIIEIKMKESEDKYNFIIMDTGFKQANNFENNEANTNEDNYKLQGYGIGLKITNELLKSIGGEMSITPNANNIGTIAIFSILKSKS